MSPYSSEFFGHTMAMVIPKCAEDLVEISSLMIYDDTTTRETSHVSVYVILNSLINVMSTPIFPRRLPPDQPPPRRDSIVEGKRTPLYGLAWVCSPRQLGKNLGSIGTGRGEYRNVISAQWKGPFGYELLPSAVHGMDGKFYLVAEWNKPHPGHTSEAIIEAARKAMGVDKDVTLEATLQWHRFPLTWLAQEEDEKEKLALKAVENIHLSNQPPGVR
ncbi:hypothetical protein BDP27DRAFT_1419212 [Rhodocollybia butyracea]|uniref:Uncharacterized protein n=1 Tax=Rhodocollybia butyracea TaxID=206335 RepID=A0A9P5PXQ0_9AGAR|nr:hypothetical protein BDP27DRAFT_1419212 [Rhodocollybia butyracea]